MRTYPLHDAQGQLVAFEVSSLLGRRLARRVIAAFPCANIVSSSLREDQFCEFEIAGIRFAIEEPFGDNSRYWIGPLDGIAVASTANLQIHFSKSRTGAWAIRASILFFCAIFALVFYQPIRRFIEQDRCLDNGNRWNHAVFKCEREKR